MSGDLLPLLTASLLVVALAAPFSYRSLAQDTRKGRDLMLVLDASGSMEFEMDGKSKFDTLLEVARNFLQKRFDDNVGIVVFGSFAYTAAPITYDLKALGFILHYLQPSIAGNATAIGDALWEAIKDLKKSKAKEKVIVLITDGHHNYGTHSPKEAVEWAKKEKIRIYTIGIGKEFDKALLERIAKESGGRSFAAKSKEDLQNIFDQIDSLEPSPLRSGIYEDKRALFWIPLTLALLLVLYRIRRLV